MLDLGRTRPGPQYLASVAVIWTEVIKLAVCVVAQARSPTASVTHCGLLGYTLMQMCYTLPLPCHLYRCACSMRDASQHPTIYLVQAMRMQASDTACWAGVLLVLMQRQPNP